MRPDPRRTHGADRVSLVKPFILVSTRPEIEAAEYEYESFLAQGGLEREQLHHVLLEEVDFLGSFAAEDVSGVFIGGSPYNASTPEASKTRTQIRVEEQVRELLAVALKEGVPVLRVNAALSKVSIPVRQVCPLTRVIGDWNLRVTGPSEDAI